MVKQKQFSLPWLVGAVVFVFLVAACGPAPEPPPPTRTPLPTFTPTTAGQQPDTGQTDTTTQTQSSGQDQQAVEAQPTDTQPPPTDTPKPAATDTPTPEPAEVVASAQINVRGGPGTNYNVIGAATQGQRFPVTGKNADGSWWQINFNGQTGWVYGQLVSTQNTAAVAVAQNIPTAPPAPPTPVPQPTQPPKPTEAPAAPQPTAVPQSNYKFRAVVQKCERQPAGNWFDGTTYVDHQPASGYKVVFSYAPDGAPITDPVISGPHAGYPGWRQGYYSHIIHATGPQAGDWYVWIVDDNGQRISDIGHWHSTGPGDDCNQATVDFDTK